VHYIRINFLTHFIIQTIEHTHPHEPLPLFSIYNNNSEEAKMTFRLLRDERYCTLDSIPSSGEIYYEIQVSNSSKDYCIKLNLQPVNLPAHFSDEINLNPKIINRKGQFLMSNKIHQHHHYTAHNKLVISIPITITAKKKKEENYLHKKVDENIVKDACRIGIEKLIEERKRFLLYQHQQQRECEWVEPSGDKCVYCTLTMH
jgi:hypothetical protein